MASRIVLLGIVPVWTDTPPIMTVRSIMATRLPTFAAAMAPFWPAGPLPITTRSYSDSLIETPAIHHATDVGSSILPGYKDSLLFGELSSRSRRLGIRGLLSALCRFPFDPLQIEYENRVEDRDQHQGDESSDRETADLGIAQRFPERAAFECERKQRKDRCAHGDHHWSNTLNAGIRKSALQRFALFVHLLDEIEQHDDVTDDDPDEACYSKKCHEPERRTHDRQSNQRSHRSVRRGRKHKQGLDGILELHQQSKVDADERDEENDGKIRESIDLLRSLARDLHLISRRKPILKIFQIGFDRSKNFRRKHSRRRKAQNRNRAKMLASSYPARFQNVPHGRNRK